jgi:hypothetical protein
MQPLRKIVSLVLVLVLTTGVTVGVATAATLQGDTVKYEVLGANSIPFGSGSAVVGPSVEFIVNAAANLGFNDGKISVDISDSSILLKGPTTNNTFRYGYETIRIFSLDFQPNGAIGSIITTVNLADSLGLAVRFGPHEVVLNLGNSLWIPGSGGSVRVDLLPVAEPSTINLLLVGAGLVGAWRVRRNALVERVQSAKGTG